MNTTRIPGFSAEASLYRSDKVFPMVADIRKEDKGIVHPAMRSIDTFCYPHFCCIVGEGFHWCWERVGTPPVLPTPLPPM